MNSLLHFVGHSNRACKWSIRNNCILIQGVQQAGSQDDLWQFMDAPLIEAISLIFDVVYLDLMYKVTAQGSVFSIIGHASFLYHYY
jgi:hypothetical protein